MDDMTQGLASSLSNRVESYKQGTHVSQHEEVLVVSHTSSDSENLSRDITMQWPSIGIMVFSSACKVLYANQAAYHFLKVLNRRENGHATDGALPVSIADLFEQILQSLESRITHHDHEQLEARRSLVGQNQSVLLRAFGVPDRLGIQQSRVVVTMEEVIRPFDAESSEAISSM
jgi:5'-3' exonuclease